MPELPEVEVVRRGIDQWATEREIARVEVLHPRAVRSMIEPLHDALVAQQFRCASRRGKYLWLPMDADECLVVHLGMSGQVLMQPSSHPDEKHLRVRIAFRDQQREMRFVDQRTFGGMYVDSLVPDSASGRIPRSVAHIARDLLDPLCDRAEVVHRIRHKDAEIKRVLLDQTVVSGIGNIYADEALWRARLHGGRSARSLRPATISELLDHAEAVMREALSQGGTSFDSLYVNVNGESGYFSRDLAAYGREGEPCLRCGNPLRREAFMNRSSFSCPRCQRRSIRKSATG